MHIICFFFFFKQKTAYEMRISDWSSDVCSSDLWRKRYFSYSGTLSNPALLDARIQLLDKMLAKGMTLSRSDLKASLDAMVRAGRQGEAVRIAMAANPSGSAGTSIYDPDFSKFAALTSRDRDNVLTFAWSLASRPGISVMIVPRSDAGQF